MLSAVRRAVGIQLAVVPGVIFVILSGDFLHGK